MGGMRDYFKAEGGATAIIFAMTLLSIIILLGGGLDFSKHRTQSQIMQAALDATALHMVQEVDIPPDEITQRARAFFDANSSGFLATITDFTATRDDDGFSVSARADVETNFLGLISIETLPVSRRANSVLSIEMLEIALVLDTTGSMAGDKIADLKTATNVLLDLLEDASDANETIYRVGIVPFDQFVRVNPDDFSDDWLDDEGRSAVAQEIFSEEINLLDLFDHLGEEWAGCIRSRGGDLAYTDAPVVFNDPDTQFLPLFAYDEGDDGSYLNNYITDLLSHPDGESSVSSFLKYGITPPNVSNPSLWSAVSTTIGGDLGPNSKCTSEPIVPLTNNFSAIRDIVDDLVARGDTQMTEAIVWGQRILSDHAPYTNALPANTFGNRKILIFLSDGINSIDGGNSDLRSALNTQGYAAIGEQATLLPPNPVADDINDYLDVEFLAACQNIKQAETQLIVIRLEQTDTTSFNLLRDCASSEADFFDVPDSSQLESVFGDLAQRITEVRLTL